MPNKKIRVAVIGAGNMGRHHVRNYINLPGAELLGIADVNPATKEMAAEYGVAYFEDYLKMLDELKPDAVSIVVPTPFHATIGLEAMKRGIHCLIEKPIASTVAEANKLIAMAKKKNLVFTVGHIERYNPLIRAIKELVVDKKKLGVITSVVCQRVGGFPKVEPKTDVIIDLAVHDIDILNYLIGRYPKAIYGHSSRTHHSQKVDSAEILMDYGKVSGFVRANWLTPVKIRTISITGSKGYLEGNYITQELTLYEHNMKKTKDSQFNSFVLSFGEPKKEIIPVKFEEPLAVELKSFLDKLSGKRDAQLVDPKDAREALKLSLIATNNVKEKRK